VLEHVHREEEVEAVRVEGQPMGVADDVGVAEEVVLQLDDVRQPEVAVARAEEERQPRQRAQGCDGVAAEPAAVVVGGPLDERLGRAP
jgi:hypothetical protein